MGVTISFLWEKDLPSDFIDHVVGDRDEGGE